MSLGLMVSAIMPCYVKSSFKGFNKQMYSHYLEKLNEKNKLRSTLDTETFIEKNVSSITGEVSAVVGFGALIGDTIITTFYIKFWQACKLSDSSYWREKQRWFNDSGYYNHIKTKQLISTILGQIKRIVYIMA